MNRHTLRKHRRRRPLPAPRLSVEPLEQRQVPSAVPLVLQPVANETADRAADPTNALLGDLTATPVVRARGVIGAGPAGAADVAWYQFTLDAPADVRLALGGRPGGAPYAGTVSLFNSDPFDFGDRYDLEGNRLLAQAAGAPDAPTGLAGPVASLDRPLAAGTYLVAVSGAGNRWFYPYLAGSGVSGSTGAYALTVSATDLGLAGAPPQLLAADVSPLVVRLDLSAPIDPFSTATLTDSAGDPPLNVSCNVSGDGQEMQVYPSQALVPGTYTVSVYDSSGGLTLTTPVTLAGDAAGPHDTRATAFDLGDITGTGLVQRPGEIGDDPYYDSGLGDPAYNPADAVNLYHFRISGPGRYGVVAEVFAGRIGSTLDAGVSVYRADPLTGQLVFVAGNNNTGNTVTGTDFSTPLLTDPAVSVGLGAGDYWVAVSSGFNTPSPLEGQSPGPGSGIFDPNASHSGTDGTSTGPYVLNLLAYAVHAAPKVVSASVSPGQTLTSSPQALSVTFSAPVNLTELAAAAFQQTGQGALSAVTIEGTDPLTWLPVRYFPRLQSFDAGSNTATFLMLDRLPAGSYRLRLSGANGLTDVPGDPLAGNDPSGDYVIPFGVAAAGPALTDMGSNWTSATAQNLGLLFPHELQATVTVTCVPDVDASSWQTDYYRFQVTQQGQAYFFGVGGADLPPGTVLTLYNAAGAQVYPAPGLPPSSVINVHLDAGTYVLKVSWPLPTARVGYRLQMRLLGEGDNPPPLASGPAPAVQVRLDAPAPAPTVVLSAPAAGGGSAVAARGADLVAAPPSGSLLALGDGPVGATANRAGPAAPPAQVAVVLPPMPMPTPGAGGEKTVLAYFEEDAPAGAAPATVPDELLDLLFGGAEAGQGDTTGPLLAPLRPLIDALLRGDWWQTVPVPLAPNEPAPAPAAGEASAEPRAEGTAFAVALAAAALGMRFSRERPASARGTLAAKRAR